MNRYRLTSTATGDLEAIRDYLVEQAGAQVARTVLTQILNAIRLLAQRPGLGHLRQDLTEEPVRFWQVFPCLIVYLPEPRPIQVVRVLHTGCDLAALLGKSSVS